MPPQAPLRMPQLTLFSTPPDPPTIDQQVRAVDTCLLNEESSEGRRPTLEHGTLEALQAITSHLDSDTLLSNSVESLWAQLHLVKHRLDKVQKEFHKSKEEWRRSNRRAKDCGREKNHKNRKTTIGREENRRWWLKLKSINYESPLLFIESHQKS
ncbi:hypothetical protein BHM03_00034382 [Ensete ventricosum]|nr:hypothetical protein BHM03_00034382 [Ensete ventricosum]